MKKPWYAWNRVDYLAGCVWIVFLYAIGWLTWLVPVYWALGVYLGKWMMRGARGD